MLGKAALFAILTAAVVVAAGCHHDKYGLKSKYKEEIFLPPKGEARFDEPPAEEWRKPPPKQQDKSLMGGGKMGGPGPGLNGGF
ncbi:MAG TPA: hypothetical protein VKE74_31560 [Gemmataceae bacterium]|nr:hypothetical protein [Gemmataceae bacterium]